MLLQGCWRYRHRRVHRFQWGELEQRRIGLNPGGEAVDDAADVVAAAIGMHEQPVVMGGLVVDSVRGHLFLAAGDSEGHFRLPGHGGRDDEQAECAEELIGNVAEAVVVAKRHHLDVVAARVEAFANLLEDAGATQVITDKRAGDRPQGLHAYLGQRQLLIQRGFGQGVVDLATAQQPQHGNAQDAQ